MKIRDNPRDIRCILFDLGQTVLAYHARLVNMRLARLCGAKDPEEVRVRIVGKRRRRPYPRFPVYRVSAGRINTSTFIREVKTKLRIDDWLPDERVKSCLRNSHDLSGRMRKLLYFLDDEKQGGRFILGIISNIPEIQWEDLVAIYSVLRLRKDDRIKDRQGDDRGVMDVHVLSFRERLMKPNRKMFLRGFRRARKIAQAHGIEIEPQQCAYFDDLEENIKAAEVVGMRAFLVQGIRYEEWGSYNAYESIAHHLEALGITLPPPDYRPPCDKL